LFDWSLLFLFSKERPTVIEHTSVADTSVVDQSEIAQGGRATQERSQFVFFLKFSEASCAEFQSNAAL
jgi:hypothetical protein